MSRLHIVQAGIENGDKKFIDRASPTKTVSATSWIVPMKAEVGDECVIYIGGYGFYATAILKGLPKERRDWPNRYGAPIARIRRIEPAISLGTIQRRIPALTWANYPRSITTPSSVVAQKIRRLIQDRRNSKLPELDNAALQEANIDELRRVALLGAKPSVKAIPRMKWERARSMAIKLYVLCRSNGVCEGCHDVAPFDRPNGDPYLEPHHTHRLADDGPDHPAREIALCPNCHRRAHHSKESLAFNARLKREVSRIERNLSQR